MGAGPHECGPWGCSVFGLGWSLGVVVAMGDLQHQACFHLLSTFTPPAPHSAYRTLSSFPRGSHDAFRVSSSPCGASSLFPEGSLPEMAPLQSPDRGWPQDSPLRFNVSHS